MKCRMGNSLGSQQSASAILRSWWPIYPSCCFCSSVRLSYPFSHLSTFSISHDSAPSSSDFVSSLPTEYPEFFWVMTVICQRLATKNLILASIIPAYFRYRGPYSNCFGESSICCPVSAGSSHSHILNIRYRLNSWVKMSFRCNFL